jgi:hypothetical protein
MKKIIFVSILMFSLITSGFANRVNVSIMSRLRADGIDIEDLERRRQEYGYIAADDDSPADKIERYNAFMEIMRNEFVSRIPDIENKIGSNANVKVTHDVPETIKNFVLDFGFYIFMDELKYGVQNEDHPDIQAVYHYMFFISLIDPHTQQIVGMYKVHGKWTSTTHLSAEEMAEMALKLLEEDQMPKVEEIEADIKHYTDYHNATIKYSETDQQANGINIGTVTVSNIQDILIGEARNNTVCRFRLEAQKGKFTETGTHWVEFDGNEIYYGGDKINFEYLTYNCSDFETNEDQDVFTLTQISLMAETYKHVVKTQIVDFKCEVLYDVYMTYYGPNFAEAEMVWRNVKIAFPDENNPVKSINPDTYDESEKVEPPYSVKIPGYGSETYYSMCQDDYDTPEIIKLYSPNGANIWLSTGEEALNYFSIESTPSSPQIHLEVGVDLYIEDTQMDLRISSETDEMVSGGLRDFKQVSLNLEIIENLSNGQAAQWEMTSAKGAKMKLEFKPIDNKKTF